MIKGFRYRIFPTKEQEVLLAKHFGCSRWIYNYALDKKIKTYQTTKESLSRFTIQKDLPELKKAEETKWLKEVNSQSLQASLENLDKSFTKFFRVAFVREAGSPTHRQWRGWVVHSMNFISNCDILFLILFLDFS